MKQNRWNQKKLNKRELHETKHRKINDTESSQTKKNRIK